MDEWSQGTQPGLQFGGRVTSTEDTQQYFQLGRRVCQYSINISTLQSTLSKRTLSKPDSTFGPLPAELRLYLCDWTLSKADTSLNRTVALVPRMSALERVECISKSTNDIV